MPYKDKARQREAVRQATRRYRAKNGDSALSGQKSISKNARGLRRAADVGDTPAVIPSVIPVDVIPCVIPNQPMMQSLPELQSYNPMMVGYVPPQGIDNG